MLGPIYLDILSLVKMTFQKNSKIKFVPETENVHRTEFSTRDGEPNILVILNILEVMLTISKILGRQEN